MIKRTMIGMIALAGMMLAFPQESHASNGPVSYDTNVEGEVLCVGIYPAITGWDQATQIDRKSVV